MIGATVMMSQQAACWHDGTKRAPFLLLLCVAVSSWDHCPADSQRPCSDLNQLCGNEFGPIGPQYHFRDRALSALPACHVPASLLVLRVSPLSTAPGFLIILQLFAARRQLPVGNPALGPAGQARCLALLSGGTLSLDIVGMSCVCPS